MKKNDREDLVFDDLYQLEGLEEKLSDKEIEEIEKRHENLGISIEPRKL